MTGPTYRIGDPVPRVEDNRMVRGRGRFVDDVRAFREAHLFLVRSPHACARIVSIDIAAASGADHVLMVATASDLSGDGLMAPGVLMAHSAPGDDAMFVPQRVGLARDAVRYVGDPVVAVVAETAAAARDAAELVDIEYDVSVPVATLERALAAGAPSVWNEAPGNIGFRVERGDAGTVDRAFASASHIVTETLRIPRAAANCLEPRACLAEWSGADERFTLTLGTHTPHAARQVLAGDVFGLPAARLRVVVPDMGGSFGMREGGFPEYIVALWAAKRLERPVRWLADRSESLQADYHGRDSLATISIALDDRSTILALRVATDTNMGAYYSQAGSYVPVGNVGSLSGVYRIPAIHVVIRGVFSHSSPTGAYRGAGRPEATYVLERIIDIAARRLGLDPVELRRRNLIPTETMPYSTGFAFTYDSGNFEANMSKALTAARWERFEDRRAESRARGNLRGIGLANTIEIAGGPMGRPFEEDASLTFGADGAAVLILGTKSHGQGHETAFTQILCDRFGLTPDMVRIVTGDTDHLPNGRGSFGSRTMAAGGAALCAAADRVVEKARRIAANEFEAGIDDVVFDEGWLSVVGTDRKLSLAEICGVAHDHVRLPAGEDVGLSAHASISASGPTFPNGTHVCEVEVDPETGVVSLLRYVLVDDIGRVINPALADGQLHGGIAQGLGEAMMEEVRYDDSGQLLTGSFQDYAMPRADDFPFFETLSNPTETKANPLGVKGVGESGTVGAMPAYVNAVVDALSSCGITHLDMPLTSEKIWRAISAAAART